MICIFTDGACSTKTRIGGWGFQVVDCEHNDDVLDVRSGAATNTTNNEMELTALANALDWVNNHIINEPVQIFCDSAYIVNCFEEEWYKKWQNNGWMTADRKPVKHQELWRHILDTYNKLNLVDPFNALRISIVKVQAHSGCSGNEAADKAAVDAKNKLAQEKGSK